jgi:predicted ATPase/class 3 adenylate cyclase
MPQLPSGTVTFLFTDIERSTQLWESVPESMRPALERHDALLRAAIDAHGGYVVKTTGDGVHAAFGRAGDALAAAVAMQEGLGAEPWPEGATVRVRIGVHTGEASERDGDYFGTVVNRAARLMAVAHGGQVVCSQSTAALAGNGSALRSLGEHRLRDLAAAEQVFQVGDGVFPPLRSVDAVPTNLPTVRTELIGRTGDVTALMALVERERLVTLTGVGGVGKTRLALGVAAALAAGFSDGCWLVELSPVADGEEVLKTVAAAVRAPATTLDALVDYMADRRVLIVLDNCEHVLDAAADLVDAIAVAAADVHVLVTSREPLGLDGEQVRRVHSLALPPAEAATAEAEASAAVRLFVERAAAVSDGFAIDGGNVTAVVDICRHLDGIPLAIELAAARVRGMAPAEIARRLDERFRLLAGGSRRSQERHRTLFATVSWSHDLLTDDERATFRRLAVFPATFDLAAAEAVAGDGTIDVVDCVLRLVDRSLVVYEAEDDRHRLLETLRQYGADRLADVGETAATRERHARHYLAFAARKAPELYDSRFASARGAVAAEIDNLRAAADWCIDAERWVELAGVCIDVWYFLAQAAPVDAATWLREVVDHDTALDDQIVVDCLGVLAWIETMIFANYEASNALVERGSARAAASDVAESPWARLGAAFAQINTAQNAEALRSAELALSTAEARGDEFIAVQALCAQGGALAALGEHERSTDVVAEALRRAEGTGHPMAISAAVISASSQEMQRSDLPRFAASLDILSRYDVDLDRGDLNGMWLEVMWGLTLVGLEQLAAVGHLARAARTADRLDTPHVLDYALRPLAIVSADAGLLEQAGALVAFAETHLRAHRIQSPVQIWIQARLDRALDSFSASAPAAPLHRREVLDLVTQIETALTRNDAASVVPPD